MCLLSVSVQGVCVWMGGTVGRSVGSCCGGWAVGRSGGWVGLWRLDVAGAGGELGSVVVGGRWLRETKHVGVVSYLRCDACEDSTGLGTRRSRWRD